MEVVAAISDPDQAHRGTCSPINLEIPTNYLGVAGVFSFAGPKNVRFDK